MLWQIYPVQALLVIYQYNLNKICIGVLFMIEYAYELVKISIYEEMFEDNLTEKQSQ
jgi:hypothetical protein